MNHSSSGLSLSKAIDGFLRFKVVEGLSETTMASYEDHLARFLSHVTDAPLRDIGPKEIESFLHWLRTDYVPQRITGSTKPLSPKTIYNIWVSLKLFFVWAIRQEFISNNPMAGVPRPRFSVRSLDPFDREEIEKLLQVCKYSRVVSTRNRRPFKMQRATYRRDRALILFLLDTSVRAFELRSLQIGDVDLNSGEVVIKHDKDGGAKGSKGRSVFIGKVTRRTLWRYKVASFRCRFGPRSSSLGICRSRKRSEGNVREGTYQTLSNVDKVEVLVQCSYDNGY